MDWSVKSTENAGGWRQRHNAVVTDWWERNKPSWRDTATGTSLGLTRQRPPSVWQDRRDRFRIPRVNTTPYLQSFFPTAIRTLHQQAATAPTPQHATAGDGGAGWRRTRRGGGCWSFWTLGSTGLYRKIAGSSPGRSGGRFFSPGSNVLTLISVSVPPPLLPQ